MSLTSAIIEHILFKLGILGELDKKYISLMDNKYIVNKTISLIDENNIEYNNNLYSAKLDIFGKKFRLLLADCSIENKEFAMVFSLDNTPEYGLYYSSEEPELNVIACFAEKWFKATTYIESNFLGGMEQIKELGVAWDRNDEIDDLYEKLIELIKFNEKT